jgi:hypothetical protein
MSDQRELPAQWLQWRDAALAGDALAAFELGTAHAAQWTEPHHVAAQGWFNHAVRLGGVEFLWQITAFYEDTTGHTPWAAIWMRRAVEAEWADCEYDVSPAAFGLYDSDADSDQYWNTVQAWWVTVTSTPPSAAAQALHAAKERVYWVCGDGSELVTEQEQEDSDENYLWSPNFIAVNAGDDGPAVLSLDRKDSVSPLMARAQIRIIVEELRAAGAVHARISSARAEEYESFLPPYSQWSVIPFPFASSESAYAVVDPPEPDGQRLA